RPVAGSRVPECAGVRAGARPRVDPCAKRIGGAGRKTQTRDATLERKTGAARDCVSGGGGPDRGRALYAGQSCALESGRRAARRSKSSGLRKIPGGGRFRDLAGIRLCPEKGLPCQRSGKTEANGRARLPGFASDQL